MSQLDWDALTDEQKQKIQAYILATTTEGNPDLPSSVVETENKALNTESKNIIGAINELNWKAQAAYNGTVNFNKRLNNVVGDESEGDKDALQEVLNDSPGRSLISAVLTNKQEVQKLKESAVTIGSTSVSELAKILLSRKNEK